MIWLAYGLYGCLIGFFLTVFMDLRARKKSQRQVHNPPSGKSLEQIVEERTGVTELKQGRPSTYAEWMSTRMS